MIGELADRFFSRPAIHALRNRLEVLRGPDAVERLFGCSLVTDGGPMDIAVHMSGGHIIVEAEPRTDEEHSGASNTVRSTPPAMASRRCSPTCIRTCRWCRSPTRWPIWRG